jgi:LuxR family quorum sensing-dependent transcriptional regulator
MSKRVDGENIALSARQRDVLLWASEGKSAQETAEILGITKATVDAHTQSATRKLGASNRAHAVALALHCHIIN